MRFVGIDLGWLVNPSGFAMLEWNGVSLSLVEKGRLGSHGDVLRWIDDVVSGSDALVAVDAPTIINNPDGMRTADRLTQNLFGKFHAGAYPANQSRPFASLTTQFGKDLQKRGFEHATNIVQRNPGRFQIEVYPHAAIVELFDLPRTIKYKRGLLSKRFAELSRYRDLLIEHLPLLCPALRLDMSLLPVLIQRGPALKAAEDQLDAVICAYVGAFWWCWGLDGSRICGSEQEGYIVVPLREFVSKQRLGKAR